MILRRAAAEVRGWTQFNWQDLFAPGQSSAPTYSGVSVSQSTAMTCSAVYSAVDLIQSTIQSLPCDVFQAYPGGKRFSRPRPHWMVNPNREMSWPVWVGQIAVSLLLDGNAFIGVGRDNQYAPVELWPLDPRLVSVERDTKTNERLFRYNGKPDAGIVHIPGLMMPGSLRGMSPVEQARQSIGRTLAAEKYAAKMFSNMATPGAVISAGQQLTKEQAAELGRRFDEAHQGTDNVHKTVVLGPNSKIETIQLTPEQVQMLETMRYGVSDVARWYRVPPHMIGDIERSTSWGTGIAEQNAMLATFTLTPWLVRIETALRSLLFDTYHDETYTCKFDLRALMRGRPQEQADYLLKKIQARAATPNEWRALDDENPLPGGDDPLNSVQWHLPGGEQE